MEVGGRGKESVGIGGRAGAEGGLEHFGMRDIVARTSRVRKAGTGGARSQGPWRSWEGLWMLFMLCDGEPWSLLNK